MATTARQRAEVPIERLAVAAFTVPTEAPESDGTLEWDSTTVVVVEVEAAGVHGLGYTYADATAAEIVQRWLVKCVVGQDAMDVPACGVSKLGYRLQIRDLSGCGPSFGTPQEEWQRPLQEPHALVVGLRPRLGATSATLQDEARVVQGGLDVNRYFRRMLHFKKSFSARRSKGEMVNTEAEIFSASTPPDVTSVRAKSSRHGKSTADKWNQ